MDESLDMVWKALSDPTRRRVIDLLAGRPRTTGELAEAFSELSRFAVMKHLRVLSEAGLVVVRREGRQRWNHLNAVPLRRIYEQWVAPRADAWATSLLRLKSVSEQERPMAFEVTGEARVYKLAQEIEIEAPRARVFKAFVDDFGRWWWRGEDGQGPPGRIETFVGGRVFHDAGDGRGDLYGHVAFYEPPRKLRITGDYCNREAVYTVVTIEFDELAAERTRVRLDHRSAGEANDAFMASFDEGWAWGLKALKEYVEGGS